MPTSSELGVLRLDAFFAVHNEDCSSPEVREPIGVKAEMFDHFLEVVGRCGVCGASLKATPGRSEFNAWHGVLAGLQRDAAALAEQRDVAYASAAELLAEEELSPAYRRLLDGVKRDDVQRPT